MKIAHSALLILAAVILIGIGYLAILPPFEGFDEIAYYSSIRQVADTGKLPIYGRSFIDESVMAYEKAGPMPWASGNPPFERAGQMTYPSFFANSRAVAHYKFYRSVPADRRFTPGLKGNWESQHPPLYYLLMAPIMRATEHFSFVTQVFILRLSSFLLAFAGFVIGWRTTRTHVGKLIPRNVAIGFLYFPFVVPMFFGEFARIGNDSLCLFLIGLIFGLSLSIFYRDEGGVARPAILGLLLGLGLLTKAFFLPITAGYALFMAVRAWQARHDRGLFHHRLLRPVVVLIPALLLGGGWYVYDFIAFGSPTGSGESMLLAQQGGLIVNLVRNFSFYTLIRDVVGIAVSWSWAGSWSLVHVSPLLHFPLLLFTGYLVASYVLNARRYSFAEPIWLPVWLLLPFLGGLFYHLLVVLALNTSGTPGWYLNILAPFLAFAVGYGMEWAGRSTVGRNSVLVGLSYAMFFLLVAIWSQMALFAGCAIKDEQKYYQFTGHLFCLDQVASVTKNLSVIGWPFLAFACIGTGFLFFAIGSAGLFVRSVQPAKNLDRTVGLTG